MKHVVVRKIRNNENMEVRDVFEKVFADTFSGNVPEFEAVTQGEQIYVALLDGSIVGMASVWEPDYFIHYLFVSQNARGRMVGSTLVNKLAEIYDKPLTLKCLTKNIVGMAFYRATGWREVETGIAEEGAYSLLRYDRC